MELDNSYCKATKEHYRNLIELGYTHSPHYKEDDMLKYNYLIVWGNMSMTSFMCPKGFTSGDLSKIGGQIHLVDGEWEEASKYKWYEDKELFKGRELVVKDSGNCSFIIDEIKDGMLIDSNGNVIGRAETFTLSSDEEIDKLKVR